MNRKIRRPNFQQHERRVVTPLGRKVRDIPLASGLPSPEDLHHELQGYIDVLMGRVPPPVEAGDLTLMEVADAYFARGCEIQFLIQEAERDGGAFRGSPYYKFRTGELRTFLELAKRAADLGSRRLTRARLEFDMQAEAEGLGWQT